MKPLKAVTTEQVVLLGDKRQYIFDNIRCVLRVYDEGCGPYLGVEGQTDEPDAEQNVHQFFFCSHDEIDQFAEICHGLMKQAEVN